MPDDRDPYDDPIERPRQRPWPDDDVHDDRRRRLSRRSDDDFGDGRFVSLTGGTGRPDKRFRR